MVSLINLNIRVERLTVGLLGNLCCLTFPVTGGRPPTRAKHGTSSRVRVDWVVRRHLGLQTQRTFHLRMMATAAGRPNMSRNMGNSSVTE